MKSLIVLSFILLLSNAMSVFAQDDVNLKELDEKSRNKYLQELAEEVTRNFGPEFYEDYDKERKPAISLLATNSGRRYYNVNLFPLGIGDETQYEYRKIDKQGNEQKVVKYKKVSGVDIWEDNGQPKCVTFRNNIFISFEHTKEPYREWVKRGIKDGERIRKGNVPEGKLILY